MKRAKQLNIIDRIGNEISREVKDAELILLATPVAQMGDILHFIAPHLGKDTLITDVGSTKNEVISAAHINLGEKVSQFIPAHPIAGGERSGPEVAKDTLFQGNKVVLTPLPENNEESVARVRQAWEKCGAAVSEMTPQQHDEVFAAVSHLPHLLSFALMHNIAQRGNREQLLSFTAGGFRDFTRIAASSPEMWRDICMSNREALIRELKKFTDELLVLQHALNDNDAVKLDETFTLAKETRTSWSAQLQ